MTSNKALLEHFIFKPDNFNAGNDEEDLYGDGFMFYSYFYGIWMGGGVWFGDGCVRPGGTGQNKEEGKKGKE